MSIQFEDSIFTAFDGLDQKFYRVHNALSYIFVCGGVVDIKSTFPPSFRDRFFSYFADQYPDLLNGLVLAENFKDYFKENAYPDLLVFESEIANISSLVLIFLESPGSLVELGMFCAKPELYSKLLVVAPQEELSTGDSFIYLGPLENLKRKGNNSVLVYPWPKVDRADYEVNHISDLCGSVLEKLEKTPNSMRFDPEHSGHLTLLIAEIIRLCYPILISEIEWAMLVLGIEVGSKTINRYIYLLSRLGVVRLYEYGNYNYYYYFGNDEAMLVSFSGGKKFDVQKAKMLIRQSFVMKGDSLSKKRLSALKEINKIKGVKK